jgi:hypothetical protein
MSEVWWDNLEPGKDEVGNQGTGMYQWVDGGKRYLAGEWPKTDPKPFVKDGSQKSFYAELPASDKPPEYPRDPSLDRKY